MPFRRISLWIVMGCSVLLLGKVLAETPPSSSGTKPGVQPPAQEAGGLPAWLPRYDLDIQLDVDKHEAKVHQRVTWTNRHQRPATELVFNAHSHYTAPDGEIGLLAKTLEILA